MRWAFQHQARAKSNRCKQKHLIVKLENIHNLLGNWSDLEYLRLHCCIVIVLSAEPIAKLYFGVERGLQWVLEHLTTPKVPNHRVTAIGRSKMLHRCERVVTQSRHGSENLLTRKQVNSPRCFICWMNTSLEIPNESQSSWLRQSNVAKNAS